MQKISKMEAIDLFNRGKDVILCTSKHDPEDPRSHPFKRRVNNLFRVPLEDIVAQMKRYVCNEYNGKQVVFYSD